MRYFKTGDAAFAGYTVDPVPVLRKICLEASSRCQLDCPLCPTARRKTRAGPIGAGFLACADFRSFVERNPQIREIELSNYGEIFLNPELPAIMECAHARDLALSANNGVNLNSLSEEAAEGLVRHRFRKLSVSIDGASQETYALYRRRGHFSRVIENIHKINKYKAQYNSEWPRLRWAFIAFGHNEHELPRAREMAKRICLPSRQGTSWSPSR
jgi:MoaA/NifB/PqqE/SkfB family radical SAM enzyme